MIRAEFGLRPSGRPEDSGDTLDRKSYVLRLGEPREPIHHLLIEVPYGPQTIFASSEITGERVRFRQQDRHVGALFTGVSLALAYQGVDPWVSTTRLLELTQGTYSESAIQTALGKLIRVGAIEAERNTRAQFGYHIIVPPNEMLRLLAAEKDIVVSPPQPDFWAKHGVIPERHYDFVAAVLEFIEANDGIIPKDDLARLDTAISISETNAKEILWNLSTRTERPLLERS